MRGVHLREGFAYERRSLTKGVRLRKVFDYERCSLTRGVRLRKVFDYEKRRLREVVHIEVQMYCHYCLDHARTWLILQRDWYKNPDQMRLGLSLRRTEICQRADC